MTVKNLTYVKINNVNYLYLIIDRINWYIEESNEDTYLMLVFTDESKDSLKKYEKLWSKIGDLIRTITTKSDDCNEKYIKIKFNSDNDLPL